MWSSIAMVVCVFFVGAPPSLRVEVLETYPHQTDAYTQGLVWTEGVLLESTGQYGASTLREVELATGAIRHQTALDETYFAEGLALVGDQLVQLTWREGVAFIYDRATFERTGQHFYSGEGWGLCFDGAHLVMSNGTSRLVKRDPVTFEIQDELQVTQDGAPRGRLNELECVGDDIYANVYPTSTIVQIDGATGDVTATISATGLLSPSEAADANVLNGIAYDPSTERFYLTGKLWPKLFAVGFVDASPQPPSATKPKKRPGCQSAPGTMWALGVILLLFARRREARVTNQTAAATARSRSGRRR